MHRNAHAQFTLQLRDQYSNALGAATGECILCQYLSHWKSGFPVQTSSCGGSANLIHQRFDACSFVREFPFTEDTTPVRFGCIFIGSRFGMQGILFTEDTITSWPSKVKIRRRFDVESAPMPEGVGLKILIDGCIKPPFLQATADFGMQVAKS